MSKERQAILFDVDNTIYAGYVIFELAELQEKTGFIPSSCLEDLKRDTLAYRTRRILYSTYAGRAMRHWARDLSGQSYTEVLDQAVDFLTHDGDKFYPYFKQVTTLLRDDYRMHLVTAEPQFVTEAIQ